MDRQTAETTVKGYLEQYLRDKGINTKKEFRCLNPNHTDNSPSMSYDKRRNKVHCFSCGADFSLLDLVAIDYGIPETDTAQIFKTAYSLYGIEVDSSRSTAREDFKPAPEYQKQARTEQNTDKGVHMETQETSFRAFFEEAHSHITETDYATKRGLSQDTIDRFCLGYVPAWKHPNAPSKAPATPRLIIPIGEYCYLARDTRSVIPEEQQDYKKSKAKGKDTVSWTFNAGAIETATQPIFIVEGELDALSIVDVGGEAVAIGSTSYTRRFLSELADRKKPTQPFIIALDKDTAGSKATQELVEGLEKLGIHSYTDNPAGQYKDASEALEHSRSQLTRLVLNITEEVKKKEAEAKQEEKLEYLKNSSASHLQEFIDGIKSSVNTQYFPTGFEKLDSILGGGLFEGLVTVGAISSLGKTSLILQIADQVAQSETDVLIFSLEMARTELMSKSISRHIARDNRTWREYSGRKDQQRDYNRL